MKQTLLNLAFKIRAHLMRNFLKPKSGYFLFKADPQRSLNPISTKFGFDRGMPVDRFYIEQFLQENSHHIKGRVLEIHDSYYTKKFGGDQVTKAEALDIDANNTQADIIGDLRHVPHIPDNTYDTIILTHTLGVIDDYPAALRECSRILKQNGIILVTVSAMGIALDVENSYWRYTIASMKYILKEFFKGSEIKAYGYGNVLSGQAFWVGLSCEDLTHQELNYNDPRYPIIIGGTAIKKNE